MELNTKLMTTVIISTDKRLLKDFIMMKVQ